MARNNAKIPGRASSDTRLSSTDLRVLIAICRCVDMETSGNHIKRETLGALSDESDLRHISRSTTRLTKLGYIQKTGNGGRSRPAYYRVFMDGERVPSDATVSTPVKGAKSTPKRVPSDTTRPPLKGCHLTPRAKTENKHKEKKKEKKPTVSVVKRSNSKPFELGAFIKKHRAEYIGDDGSAEPLSKKTN